LATVIDSVDTEFGDWLGDARLTCGSGSCAACYTVDGTVFWKEGHHGDQLRYATTPAPFPAAGSGAAHTQSPSSSRGATVTIPSKPDPMVRSVGFSAQRVRPR